MHTLYLCATPIGNLEDVTLRLLRILGEVSLIACEDTRHSAKLLNHYEIKKPLLSYHEHNKMKAGERIIAHLRENGDVALLTDAGMPAISDPGFELVQRCREEGIPYTVLPGPSASLTALVLSGMRGDRFSFEGFLPRSGKERRERLSALREEERTVILYEAPHRLVETLDDLKEVIGERAVAICRELTKQYEEVRCASAAEHAAYFREQAPRGEFVLVVAGAEPIAPNWDDALAFAESLLASGHRTKEAAKEAALQYPGISRRDLYQALIDRK